MLEYITIRLPPPASWWLQVCWPSTTADLPAVPGYRLDVGGDYCNIRLVLLPGGRRGRPVGVVRQVDRPASPHPCARPAGAARPRAPAEWLREAGRLMGEGR